MREGQWNIPESAAHGEQWENASDLADFDFEFADLFFFSEITLFLDSTWEIFRIPRVVEVAVDSVDLHVKPEEE